MDRHDVTQILLKGTQRGRLSRDAADEIFASAYEELRRLASRAMRRERNGHTLQPTALLNELYLRLVDRTQINWQNRAHFFGIAARAMRQILVEHARRRSRIKRGGGWERVLLTDDVGLTDGPTIDAMVLNDAITKVAEKNERLARVVELRVFAGLSGKEIAEALDVSRKTVSGDWRVATMWLRAELAGEDLP